MDALARIHRRINEIADQEARDAKVSGWAAQGHLMPEKLRLIQRTEEILDELMSDAPHTPKSTKLPRKLPDDPIARGVAIMREATGQVGKQPKKAPR
jgi:hypothetical protein